MIEQAAQVGVHHWALQFLKGELLTHNWERLGLSQQEGLDAAILAYSQSHKLRPSWHAKFGCAIATTDQNQVSAHFAGNLFFLLLVSLPASTPEGSTEKAF